MSSTSCITGTGFMKCMPMTASGRFVAAAMRVMGMEEVLVASTPPGRTTASRSWKIRFFSSSFSVAASIATSTSFASFAEVAVLSRLSTVRSALSSSLPFSRSFPRPERIRPAPFSTASFATSTRVTRSPAVSAICAIPAPICPAPTTSTCSLAIFALRLGPALYCRLPERSTVAGEEWRVHHLLRAEHQLLGATPLGAILEPREAQHPDRPRAKRQLLAERALRGVRPLGTGEQRVPAPQLHLGGDDGQTERSVPNERPWLRQERAPQEHDAHCHERDRDEPAQELRALAQGCRTVGGLRRHSDFFLGP